MLVVPTSQLPLPSTLLFFFFEKYKKKNRMRLKDSCVGNKYMKKLKDNICRSWWIIS